MKTTTRRATIGITVLAVAVTGAGLAAMLRPQAEAPAAEPEAVAAAPAPTPSSKPADFDVTVAADVRPAVAEIEGFEDGGPARPVGRIDGADGTSDVVLDEVIVSTRSDEELEAFLARWNGDVLDSFPPDDDGLTDHLVRIDTTTVDTTTVAADLASFEAHDDLRVSDERTLRLLAVAASETANHGTLVTLNPLAASTDVEDGTATEASDRSNPFTWSYLKGGGVQDFAVAPAWQLLEAHDKLKRTVTVLVHDGGFSHNPDFPEDSTIRSAKWGEENRMDCGDDDCPFHGTHVALTVAGQLDNEYGTVGSAGPVVDELIVVAVYSDQWKRLRNLDDMVDLYRPDIVNMSYSSNITVAKSAAQALYDRRYKGMHDRGALLFASAGNKGSDVDTETCIFGNCSENRLVMPCESTYVVCVGGLDRNSIERDPSSNYGQDDDRRSVEIWGPYETVSINDPNMTYLDFTTSWVYGTSFSSPFVAGIGALVKAADPSLGPDEIREILNETANDGVPGQWITGSHRRVDALAAVARALDVDLDAPKIEITNPTNGKQYAVSSWLQLKGSAVDYRDVKLPITWVSSLDGQLGNQVGTVSLGELSLGTHRLTATATDPLGQETTEHITFEVIRRPIEITISSPADGATIEEGDPLVLAAGTTDPDDYYQSLADDKVRWEIRRASGGSPVYEKSGHDRIVDTSSFAPGDYTIEFFATAHGTTVSDSRSITIEALPEGQTKPVAKIHTPTSGTELYTGGGAVDLKLVGSAVDAEDGVLSGTRFRWLAKAGDETVVLCTGSAFKAPAGGGVAIQGAAKDCSNVTVELGVSPEAPGDYTWQIWLEARDFSNRIGRTPVNLDVILQVG
jgi:serine protease